MEMANHKRTVFTSEMHTVSFAVAEEFACVAGFYPAHPLTVAIRLKAVFPNGPEIVLINIALVVLATDRGAGRDTAIDKDRSHTDTCHAMEEMVTDFSFVAAQETFATI